MDAHAPKASPRLILEIADTTLELDPSCAPAKVTLRLGKEADNDLVVNHDATSRQHASIEFRNNDFFVVDGSTNGTYVQTEDQVVTHVHRNTLRLWGCGWISLGTPVNDGQPIYFRQAGASERAMG